MAPSLVFCVSMVLAWRTSRFIDCRRIRAISSGVLSVEPPALEQLGRATVALIGTAAFSSKAGSEGSCDRFS
uniref:Putative secreted protein n=1 Tax=Anopheles darlingi TaxID=43151 RepID=A0A2M4D4S9_ANODA